MESLRLQTESSFFSRNELNMDSVRVHLSRLKDQDEQNSHQISH